jgi:hypothetical protein
MEDLNPQVQGSRSRQCRPGQLWPLVEGVLNAPWTTRLPRRFASAWTSSWAGWKARSRFLSRNAARARTIEMLEQSATAGSRDLLQKPSPALPKTTRNGPGSGRPTFQTLKQQIRSENEIRNKSNTRNDQTTSSEVARLAGIAELGEFGYFVLVASYWVFDLFRFEFRICLRVTALTLLAAPCYLHICPISLPAACDKDATA